MTRKTITYLCFLCCYRLRAETRSLDRVQMLSLTLFLGSSTPSAFISLHTVLQIYSTYVQSLSYSNVKIHTFSCPNFVLLRVSLVSTRSPHQLLHTYFNANRMHLYFGVLVTPNGVTKSTFGDPGAPGDPGSRAYPYVRLSLTLS